MICLERVKLNVPGQSFPIKFFRLEGILEASYEEDSGEELFYALAEDPAHSPEENRYYSRKLFQDASKYHLTGVEL
ncbi:hypothetical protein D0Z07_6364 [Hyphodiscus hymeniophilus]|uniref:Uncharacterized protein n=1 Tax=Hyphodiscus hymeniophilus TaxID=353542 RepID=A0A9P7AUL0_9HELO|nr:hypothetical protein D0Z07_6364 [Hyphodiscus hymeniophilus]